MGTYVKQRNKQCCGSERAELLLAYRHSGLSQKEWCRAQGVAISTLGRWLKLEKEQVNSQTAQGWAPVAVSPPVREESDRLCLNPKSMMVTVSPPVQEQTILLKSGKFSITVGKNTDRKLLSEVLALLVTLC